MSLRHQEPNNRRHDSDPRELEAQPQRPATRGGGQRLPDGGVADLLSHRAHHRPDDGRGEQMLPSQLLGRRCDQRLEMNRCKFNVSLKFIQLHKYTIYRF